MAWLPIYRELAPAVLRYLWASGARAPEDLLGAVTVQLARELPGYTGTARELRARALTLAHGRLLDERGRAGWPPRPRPRLETVAVDKVLRGARDDVSRRLAEALALGIVERLAPAQGDVLRLRVFAGLTVGEVARVVGGRPSRVRALQRRALCAVRRELAREAWSCVGGHPDCAADQGRRPRLDHEEVERLLTGRVRGDDPRSGDLAVFLDCLREACPQLSPAAWEAAHIAAMVDAAERRLAEARAAVRPGRESRGLMTLTRAPRVAVHANAPRGPHPTGVARSLVLAAALTLVFGGVAVAGALPGPLERMVRDVVGQLGVQLPYGKAQPAPPDTAAQHDGHGAADLASPSVSHRVRHGSGDARDGATSHRARGRPDQHKKGDAKVGHTRGHEHGHKERKLDNGGHGEKGVRPARANHGAGPPVSRHDDKKADTSHTAAGKDQGGR